MNIHVQNSHFVDEHGRRLLLHGVNLAGSSKIPFVPDGSTYIRDGFFDHRNVSFVGRPFPLEQADEHLDRLRQWGFNFLRLIITWEAIEHAGPGIYDEKYLDYIAEVVKKAGAHGFNLFIDPHQDVWSRFSGGDGAPGWTLEAVGFDPTHFAETVAAIVHATHSDPYPRMIWATNESKLACATMFTLFFGGNDFAPNTRVDGEPVQEYLQRHYIEAIRQVALRVKDQPNMIGYDTMNEPLSGYIGRKDLNSPSGLLTLGDVPTPIQSMALGSGHSVEVSQWEFGIAGFKLVGTRRMNENRQRAWKDGWDCIWKQNGVWDVDSHGNPELIRPGYFSERNGIPVDFTDDYYRPFANRYAQSIRTAHPGALIFIETENDTLISRWGEQDAADIVYAPHWYDGYLVAKKEFTPLLGVDSRKRKLIIGPAAIRGSFRQQLASLKQNALDELGEVPIILGEFGIPFDLHGKEAYQTENYKTQVKALQRSMLAVEENLLDYTLWVYTPDNTNLHGDLWNDEDFSIFSTDQRTDLRDIYSGGRALEAVIRPYPLATSGELLRACFNPNKRIFKLRFRHDTAISAPTEIFVPNYQYPHGYSIEVSDGHYEIKRSQQRLFYWPSSEMAIHNITIKP